MLLCMKGLRALCPRMGGQKGSLSRMWGDQNHHTSLSRSARGSRPLGVFAACLGPEWWQRLGWGCSPRSQQGLGGALLSTPSHPAPRRPCHDRAHFQGTEIKL